MIYKRTETGFQRVDSTDFESEKSLHEALEKCPSLILEKGEPENRLVGSHVRLLDDEADLVFLDEDMLLTVVEVKLGRNGEARRTIIGQVFDYVSSLAQMTFDQLDEQMDDKLVAIIKEFCGKMGDEAAYEELRRKCSAYLKAGNIRIAVVVDTAPSKLVKIMQYLAERSDLDVRLIKITQYQDEMGDSFFVPQMLVSSASNKALFPEERQVNERLVSAVGEFERQWSGEGTVTGKATNYRQVRILNWPNSVHYEFLYSRSDDTLSVELHVENPKHCSLIEALSEIAQKIKSRNGLSDVVHDPLWSKRCGRIKLSFPDTAEPQAVSKAMIDLISATKDHVSEQLSIVPA